MTTIFTKKEVVDIVKDTLNPFFKDYGLGYDDFKNIAKTATNKITQFPIFTAQVQLVVYQTLSEARPDSVSDDGWSFCQRNIERVSEEINFANQQRKQQNNEDNFKRGDEENSNNDDDEYNGSSSSNNINTKSSRQQHQQMLSGDEKITVASFKSFLANVRQKKSEQQTLNVSGQRRQRI